MANPSTLKEYLVKIGWDVDELGFNKASSAVEAFSLKFFKSASGIAKDFIKAGSVIADVITDVNKKMFSLLDTTAKQDLQVEKLARRYWTTEQNARALANAQEITGTSLQELMYSTPEEYSRFMELMRFGKGLEAPKEVESTLVKIRDIQQEFNKLKTLINYSARWISYYIGQYLGKDIDKIREKFKSFNDWLKENLPKITNTIAKVFVVFYKGAKTVLEVGRAIWNSLSNLFDKIPAEIKTLFAVITPLILAFLSGPVGLLIAGIAAAILLIDDYLGWKRGAESYFDWTKIDEQIQNIKSTFSDFKSAIGDLWDALSPLLDGFKELFGLSDEGRSFGDLITDIFSSINLLFKEITSDINVLTQFIKWVKGEISWSDFKNNVAQIGAEKAANYNKLAGVVMQGDENYYSARGRDGGVFGYDFDANGEISKSTIRGFGSKASDIIVNDNTKTNVNVTVAQDPLTGAYTASSNIARNTEYVPRIS